MRLGIIGLGVMSEIMINWTRNNPDVSITHVCDVSEQRVQKFASELGAAGHTDYKALLAQKNVDAVYVCVPPALHFQVVTLAFQEGKHVLCEKPLANSVEEARGLMELAQKTDLVNGIHFTLQYGSAIPKLQELYRQGYLGKLRRLEINLRFPHWPRLAQHVGWVGSRLQGGMALEVCIHLINIFQTTFGRIVHVETELEYPDNPELSEDGMVSRMELEDGTPIYVNTLANMPANEEIISISCYGKQGVLHMPNWDQLIGGKIGEEVKEIQGAQPISVMTELHKAIQGKEARIIDFKAGYEAQIVMEALRGRHTLVRK